MCYGFSCIATMDGSIYWTEPNSEGNISHESILGRLKLKDEDYVGRKFVRIEFPKWTEESFRWDEGSNELPAWCDAEEVREKASKLMLRVKKVYEANKPTNPVNLAAILQAIEDIRNNIATEYEDRLPEDRKKDLIELHGLMGTERSYQKTPKMCKLEVFRRMVGYVPE